jgi:hypothetical protein
MCQHPFLVLPATAGWPGGYATRPGGPVKMARCHQGSPSPPRRHWVSGSTSISVSAGLGLPASMFRGRFAYLDGELATGRVRHVRIRL